MIKSAEEARLITTKNLHGPVIEPYLEEVYAKIQTAAEKGQSSIAHPFAGMRRPYPSTEVQRAVWAALRKAGFTVTHHPDPDPGHPASSPYDSISW